jgi:hypothetical protein
MAADPMTPQAFIEAKERIKPLFGECRAILCSFARRGSSSRLPDRGRGVAHASERTKHPATAQADTVKRVLPLSVGSAVSMPVRV